MVTKKGKKENAKTRYDAKKPTVSFLVSFEEYEHLDALRKSGVSFREMVLKGAGMIEKDKAKWKEERAAELFRIQEAAKVEVLKKAWIGNCARCGKLLSWSLCDPYQVKLLANAVNKAIYIHTDVSNDRK